MYTYTFSLSKSRGWDSGSVSEIVLTVSLAAACAPPSRAGVTTTPGEEPAGLPRSEPEPDLVRSILPLLSLGKKLNPGL